MPDTIDHQLEHLAELHAGGALTDDEFATAKATALSGSSPAPASDPATDGPILAAPRPSIPPKLVPLLIVFAAAVIGITITGMSTGLEWAPAQAPAAPIVCPGGELIAGFDVAYTVNAKGVDLASVCVKGGETREISGLWLGTVMTVEYTALVFVILYGWCLLGLRKQRNRRSLATWSSEPSPPSDAGSDNGA